jgi:TP901 family phage tail tape measure protein
MSTNGLIRAGVRLELLDRMTPQLRRALASGRGMLDGFSRATNQHSAFGPMAQQNLAQYERGLGRIAQSQKLLLVGMGGAGAGIAAQKMAYSAFNRFEEDLAYIDTLRDGNTKAMDKWGKEMRRIAGDTGKDLGDISAGIYQALSSSIPEEGVMKFISGVSKTAVGGRTSIENSVNALATVLNSYDLKVTDAMNVSDKLFYTVKRGRVEFNQLSDSIARFASSGALAKVPIEDLLTAFATLTSVGIVPAEAATSLNSFMKSIVALSDEQKELGKSMGIEFNISHLQSVGLLPFLQQIEEAVDGDIEKLQKLFPEIEAFRAVAPLVGSAKERYKDIQQGMLNKTAGATERAYETMADTNQNKLDRLKQNYESILVGVGGMLGEGINPGLEVLVSTLSDIAQDDEKLAAVAKTIQTITNTLITLAGVGALGMASGGVTAMGAGVKTALTTGKLVGNSGGLALIGSVFGKLFTMAKGLAPALTGLGATGGSAGWVAGGLAQGTLGATATTTGILGTGAATAGGATIGTIALPALITTAIASAVVYGLKKGSEAIIDKEYERWSSGTSVKLQNLAWQVYEDRTTNDSSSSIAKKARSKNMSTTEWIKQKIMEELPEGLATASGETLGKNIDPFKKPSLFGMDHDITYANRDKGWSKMKKGLKQYAGDMMTINPTGTFTMANTYKSQALDYFGGDKELANSIMPYLASGLFPEILREFETKRAEKEEQMRGIDGGKALKAIQSINKMSPERTTMSTMGIWGDRYGVNNIPDKELPEGPERDEWQIVVNINGERSEAVLRKNGSSVKNIESMIGEIKKSNSYTRNPSYYEKPR